MISNSLSSSEFDEISYKLEAHHSIFYKLWEMGEMIFDDTIPTACVKFDRTGNYVSFHFNPDFWKEKTTYERLFIICHECLHVWLNHGLRTRNAEFPSMVNTALDVVVNHMLVENFGFKRHKIKDYQELCWVDTIFDEKDGEIKQNETFEYYYNKIIESPNTNFVDCKLVDMHENLEDVDYDKIVNKIGEDLSEQERQDISKAIKNKIEKSNSQSAGTSSIDKWEDMNVPSKIKRKKAWYELIKKWAINKCRSNANAEQWTRQNRRLSFLNTDNNLMLPSDNDDISNDNDKVEMWLYLDVSGSCAGLRNDFYCASLTIPQDRIKLRTFCFDTKITEVNLKDKKLIVGGGTSFEIIENHIRNTLTKGKKHPVIFVFTDGYGDVVTPKEANKWHWFIDGNDWNLNRAKNLVNGKSNFYSMNDFK